MVLEIHESKGEKYRKVNFGGSGEQLILDILENLGNMAAGKFVAKPGSSWEEDQMYEEFVFMIEGDLTVKDRETGKEVKASAGDVVFVSYAKLKWSTEKGCELWFVSYPPWKTAPPPQLG